MASMAEIEDRGITAADIESELLHWNENKGPVVITTLTIFYACAVAAVFLRLITRKLVVKIPWQIDDYAITVALASNKLSRDDVDISNFLAGFCIGPLY